MDELDQVSSPSHVPDEAPVSSELRDKASQDLDSIKQLIEEARESGTLTKEDEDVLREWLTQDVKARVDQAEQHDAQRQTLLASGMVTKAIETVHVGEDGSVMTPSEHQDELAYRQQHGHSSTETTTRI